MVVQSRGLGRLGRQLESGNFRHSISTLRFVCKLTQNYTLTELPPTKHRDFHLATIW